MREKDREKTVSVIIPSYNRPDVSKAVESALNQSHQNLEVIVVDDNSETPVETLLEEIEDERLQIIRHDENKNGAAARNTGIDSASGDYVAFLDDDDKWHKNKITLQLEKLEKKGPEFQACYTGTRVVYPSKTQEIIETQEGDIRTELLKKKVSGSFGSTLIVEKEIVDNIGGFDENFDRHQDWEFLFRVLGETKICVVEKALIDRYGSYGYSTDVKTLVESKEKYLEKYSNYLNDLGKTEKRKIESLHYLEIAQSGSYQGKYHLAAEYWLRSISLWTFQNPTEILKPLYYILNNRN